MDVVMTTSPSLLVGDNDDDAATCSAFVDNVTAMLDAFTSHHGIDLGGNKTGPERSLRVAEYLVKRMVEPSICAFGIVGNLLNLIVLTRKRLQCSMDRMEKSAHVGLVALAVSDLLFCLVYLMTLVVPSKTAYMGGRHWLFGLYFGVYKEAIVNVFALTSTWLTVVMAIGRYVVVCRPLHARGYISLRGTKASIVAVLVLSVLVNIPRMFLYDVIDNECSEFGPTPDNCSCKYFMKYTGSTYSQQAELAYSLVWFLIAILIPLIILTACNVCLIRALQQSRRLQRLCRANNPSTTPGQTAPLAGSSGGSTHGGHGSGGHNRITPTLVSLIVLFIVCVSPSGILDFLRQLIVYRSDGSSAGYFDYMTSLVFANCLYLVNFAVNFVLYCVVNVHFRRTARDIICCAWLVGSSQAGGQRGGRGGVGASARGRLGRSGYECSIGPGGATTASGRTRTACTSVLGGSTPCLDAIYLHDNKPPPTVVVSQVETEM